MARLDPGAHAQIGVAQLDFSGYPNIMAWVARLDALPAWQATVIKLG